MFTMSNERTPLGIEGAPTTKASPVGIAILVIIIALACIAVYYYSPGLYPSEEGEGGPTLPKAVFNDEYSDTIEDADSDGFHDYLCIDIGLLVENEGGFKINASLYDPDGNYIVSTYSSASLGVGNQTITLKFEGLDIYLQGANGSYALKYLTLYETTNWTKVDHRDWAWNTTSYNYTDFQNKYHAEYTGTIPRSSSSPEIHSENTTQEYSFEVKERPKLITVTVNFTSGKDLDLYIYYKEEELTSSINHGGETEETINLDEGQIPEKYGVWIALIHNYSEWYKPLNSADYHITIDVVYE